MLERAERRRRRRRGMEMEGLYRRQRGGSKGGLDELSQIKSAKRVESRAWEEHDEQARGHDTIVAAT